MINRADGPGMRRPNRRRTGAKLLAGVLAVVASCLAVAPTPVSAATVYYDGAAGAARIGVIGDSSVAGIRWTNQFRPLQALNFTFDAESCRRTTARSCRGREGYTPESAITVLRRLSGQWGSVLVMGTGYNDPGVSFGSAVDAIMAEARRQGIPRVMWMTMRTADVSYVAPTYRSNAYTFRDNNRILIQKAQQYGGRLQVADWATYSAGRSSWFAYDGIHYTTAGSNAAAQFIATQATRVIRGEAITPFVPSAPVTSAWVTVRRGDRGPQVATVQRALIAIGMSVPGGVDGVFNTYTEAAVSRFQSRRGLPRTGIVDAATATSLGLIVGGRPVPAPTPVPSPTTWSNLGMGSRGTRVAAAQRAVMNSGIYLRGGADGIYGSYTTAAVRLYQRNRGLPQTGVVDAATATAMGLFKPSITPRPTPVPPGGPAPARTYTVVRGDSLYGIARKSGVSIDVLLSLNNLRLNSVIHPGMVLTVAAGSAASSRLATTAAPASWANLAIGSRGASVAAAQRAVINSGIYLRGGADGIFGPYTQAALRQYQRNRGLAQTGVVDTPTAQAMGLYTPPPPPRPASTTTTTSPTVAAATAAAPPATAAQAVAVAVAEPTSASAARPDAPASTDDSAAVTEPEPLATATSDVESTEAATDSVIGDVVWLDDDRNGQQGSDEPGLGGVTLRLLGSDGTVLATTMTDQTGAFAFVGLPAANYGVQVVVTDGYEVSTTDAGSDEATDSDAVADEPTGTDERTATVGGVSVDGTAKNVDSDIGLVEMADQSSPVVSEPTDSTDAAAPPASVAPEPTNSPEAVATAPAPESPPDTDSAPSSLPAG